MAQLVARLVRNEKVGGSNPPSSTENPVLDQRVPVFYCLRRVFVGRVSWTGLSGYRTLRVAGGVTFRLIDAGKSLLKAVGVTVEDQQSVVVVSRLVGLLARESRC